MSNEVYIFDATEANFSEVVLQNSSTLPVIVEFMGVWSEHCFYVEEIFRILANEFSGQFIFVKVDIDEQVELRKQFSIESVPTIISFKDGEKARVDVGELTEPEARDILKDFGIFHESDALRAQAREKHVQGDTSGAIMLLTQAIQKHPSNTKIAMDMVQIFVDIGDLKNAEGLFNKLPEKDRESDVGKSLLTRLSFTKLAIKTDGLEALQQRIDQDDEDLAAKFDIAVCFVAVYDFQNAMEHLLQSIEKSPEFNEGAAREMMVTLIRIIKDNNPELSEVYHRKLSSLLN